MTCYINLTDYGLTGIDLPETTGCDDALIFNPDPDIITTLEETKPLYPYWIIVAFAIGIIIGFRMRFKKNER